MRLDRGIPVEYGRFSAVIFGGKFTAFDPKERRLVGVKMAREISHPHDISIPTEDFSVPDVTEMQDGMVRAIEAIVSGKDIYAGCMGGIGRTGLFMGCMAKTMFDLRGTYQDPVRFVRLLYSTHAIETDQQMEYVRRFDTAPVLRRVAGILGPQMDAPPSVSWFGRLQLIAKELWGRFTS